MNSVGSVVTFFRVMVLGTVTFYCFLQPVPSEPTVLTVSTSVIVRETRATRRRGSAPRGAPKAGWDPNVIKAWSSFIQMCLRLYWVSKRFLKQNTSTSEDKCNFIKNKIIFLEISIEFRYFQIVRRVFLARIVPISVATVWVVRPVTLCLASARMAGASRAGRATGVNKVSQVHCKSL